MSPLYQILESVGLLAFALSGGLVAARKELDIIGFAVLALMPAVGGGTMRDLILGVPVFWISDTRPIWITAIAVLLAYYGERHLVSRHKVIIWADALGLSLFAVAGAHKAFTITGDPLIAIIMGMTTGVAGGMIRDIIANEMPLVLNPEVYATAAFGSAAAYAVLAYTSLPVLWVASIAFLFGFIIRGCAIIWGLSLPRRKR